jgi:hypothetical protein
MLKSSNCSTAWGHLPMTACTNCSSMKRRRGQHAGAGLMHHQHAWKHETLQPTRGPTNQRSRTGIQSVMLTCVCHTCVE